MDERSERIRRRLEPIVLVAAVFVIPVIVIQESDASDDLQLAANVGNWLIWLVFAAELVIMLAVVPDRRAYLRKNPLDLAVVVLTPPVMPATFQAARALRLLRLLRLLKAAKTLRGFFSLDGLRWAAIATAFVVIGGGAAFSAVEKGQDLDVWNGLYWAITTVTTIGGSITPDTTAGRIIEVTVLLTGIGFIAMLTGALAEQFIGTVDEEREDDEIEAEDEVLSELRVLHERLDRIEGALGTRR